MCLGCRKMAHDMINRCDVQIDFLFEKAEQVFERIAFESVCKYLLGSIGTN